VVDYVILDTLLNASKLIRYEIIIGLDTSQHTDFGALFRTALCASSADNLESPEKSDSAFEMERAMFFDLFNELVWFLIVMVALVFIAAKYWTNPLTSSVREKLRQSEAQVTKLKKLSETMAQTIHDLDSKLQKQLESVEGKVTHLGTEVGEIRREARDIDKHVDTLETKTTVAVSKVQTILHQVDTDVGELKRMDDQIKDNIGKAKSNAIHIRDLEDEVRVIERELAVAPVRLRRDHHAD
jgi:methyl-accepting chemotaxis protein